MHQRNPQPVITSAERLSANTALSEYYSAPKYFGETPINQLVATLRKAADAADTIEDAHAAMAYNEVLASGLVELGLTSHSIGEAIDERIATIELARPIFREIADTRYHELQTGYRHPDDQIEWRRAELQYDFAAGHVYSDLVSGEITPETKTETLQMLRRHLDYVKQLGVTRYGKSAKGLESELVALIDWWKKLDYTDVAVAIPATARGGSGVHNRNDTHDLAVAHFVPEKDTEPYWEFYEVKTQNALTTEHLARYASGLVVVGKQPDRIDIIPDQETIRQESLRAV